MFAPPPTLAILLHPEDSMPVIEIHYITSLLAAGTISAISIDTSIFDEKVSIAGDPLELACRFGSDLELLLLRA